MRRKAHLSGQPVNRVICPSITRFHRQDGFALNKTVVAAKAVIIDQYIRHATRKRQNPIAKHVAPSILGSEAAALCVEKYEALHVVVKTYAPFAAHRASRLTLNGRHVNELSARRSCSKEHLSGCARRIVMRQQFVARRKLRNHRCTGRKAARSNNDAEPRIEADLGAVAHSGKNADNSGHALRSHLRKKGQGPAVCNDAGAKLCSPRAQLPDITFAVRHHRLVSSREKRTGDLVNLSLKFDAQPFEPTHDRAGLDRETHQPSRISLRPCICQEQAEKIFNAVLNPYRMLPLRIHGSKVAARNQRIAADRRHLLQHDHARSDLCRTGSCGKPRAAASDNNDIG